MSRDYLETAVGGLVLAAAVGFLLYVNDIRGGSAEDGTYELVAYFGRANGLAVGSEVRLAGVRIGSVREVRIDYDRYQAEVRMEVAAASRIPEDSTAQIRGDGLFGSSYIGVVPGGSDEMLDTGEVFSVTQGAVDLVDLLGRAVAGGE